MIESMIRTYVLCNPIYPTGGMHNHRRPTTDSQSMSPKIRRFPRVLEIATFMETYDIQT